jgi:hypothetical protein
MADIPIFIMFFLLFRNGKNMMKIIVSPNGKFIAEGIAFFKTDDTPFARIELELDY